MKIHILHLALIATLHVINAQDKESHIINGDIVIQNHPYQWAHSGSLMLGDPLTLTGIHTCGIVIVSVDFGITAAHCMGTVDNRWARFGSVNFDNDPGISVTFKRVIIHEEWGDLGECLIDCYANDIAAVEFSESLTFTSTVNRATLANQGDYNPVDCMIMGWGAVDPANDVPMRDMHEAAVSVVSDANCSDALGLFYHPAHHVCIYDTDATGGRGGPCSGDSGSAVICWNELTVSQRLVGLCSWVFLDNDTGLPCNTDLPSGYVDIVDYRDWICEKTDVCY